MDGKLFNWDTNIRWKEEGEEYKLLPVVKVEGSFCQKTHRLGIFPEIKELSGMETKGSEGVRRFRPFPVYPILFPLNVNYENEITR